MTTTEALRTVLEDLQNERKKVAERLNEIDITIRELTRRVSALTNRAELPVPGTDIVEGATEEEAKDTDKPYAGMSNPDAAKAYLRAAGKPKNTAEVRKALKAGGITTEAKNFHSTVYTALKRLAESGEIRDLGGGRWAALPDPDEPRAGDGELFG